MRGNSPNKPDDTVCTLCMYAAVGVQEYYWNTALWLGDAEEVTAVGVHI